MYLQLLKVSSNQITTFKKNPVSKTNISIRTMDPVLR